jgi:CubicO group peptidase (beta-lactamase class C family)
MKSIIFFFLLLFSFTVIAQRKSAPADPLAGIDTLMERILKERKAAGFAVAVVVKDKIVFAKGYGYRDYENKLPVTPNTSFAIGSCSKAFTSMLLGLLNKDGKLDYDKPVRDYLPNVKFFNDELTKNVTVRDMMCHRTGLPRHDYSWYLFNTNSRDSMVQRIQYQEPTAPLRQTWQYNNFMFLLQGVIAEKLYGGSWEKNVEQKILQPLGMKTSTTTIADLKKSPEPAKGYYVFKDSLIKHMDYYDINAMSPAGSINSSVNEMANWVIAWINGGKFNGKELFPAGYMKEAMSSQMVIGAALPDKEKPDVHFATYGFGWMLGSYRGHYRVEHGGNIDGFSASTCFFPSDSLGIIVLTNQNGSAVTSLVRNSIADRMLKQKPYDWLGDRMKADAKAKADAKEAEKKVTSNRKTGTKPSHLQKDYEGLFNHKGYGSLEVFVKNDSLFFRTANDVTWMKHYHYDVFELYTVDEKEGVDTTNKAPVNLQFHMNATGEIDKITLGLQPGLDDLVFNRIPKPKEITKADLEKFVGEYELGPGAVAKFYIKSEKTLYVFIEGQPEYELVAVDKNKFDLKILKGYSVLFDENEKGEITAVSFIQPEGTFKAKKKAQ